MSIRKFVLMVAYAALIIAMATAARAGVRLTCSGSMGEVEGCAENAFVP